MRKIRSIQTQTAQGLVEFALVLPVLMLIILGIFAFGHFFFAYSSIVSASREAARWGAAVGTSTNGYPRYKDCDAIRDAAVRVGSFAGVTRSTVTITYDNGPSDTTNPKPDCPMAAGSQGPDVALGYRINVNVSVLYTPIVPLLQLPSIPITATTSRTILLGLPVGDVPTAAAIYPTTTLDVTVNGVPVALSNPGSSSIVGQVFTIAVKVNASNNAIPTGNIYIGDDSVPQQLCGPLALDANGSASCTSFVYNTVTTDPVTGVNTPHKIGIVYDPNGAHFNTSNVTVNHSVAQATSTTTITSITPTSPATPSQTVSVKINVAPQFSGVPTGKVELRRADQSVLASGNLDASGNVTLSFSPTWTGSDSLTAYYQGDANFTASNSAGAAYLIQALDVNINPQPNTGTVNTPVNFNVIVTSATGAGGTPTGSVTVFDTTGHSCSATLNPSGVGTCAITFTTAGAYNMTARYTSANLTFKDKDQPFTLNIINKIATYVQLSPASSTISPTMSMKFSVNVTQADNTIPTGTVTVTGSQGSSCTITLNNTQTGSCSISPISAIGQYSFVANFTPTNSTTYSSSISNTVTVTVASMCPTASNTQVSTSSIQFNVNNTSPNNVALNLNQISVSWSPIINPLKDIVFTISSQLGGTCSSTGTNNICVWAYKRQNANDTVGGITPSPQVFSSSVNQGGWDSTLANISAGQVKVLRIDFVNTGIQSPINVTMNFDQGCSLSVGQ